MPELEERVAKAWFECIPLQYRPSNNRNRSVSGDRFYSSAIILPPPPGFDCRSIPYKHFRPAALDPKADRGEARP
jgi:hypothetical protein